MELIGEGRHGVVYRSWNEASRSWVAVKVLHTRPSEQDWLRWQEQAGRLSRFSHPHIAEIYEVGRKDGQPYVVTEFLPGGTLRSRIDARKSAGDSLPFQDLLSYAVQIADALAGAHDHHIYHRNLKAANVMFTGAGVLKLTDFDVNASGIDESGEESDIMGFAILLIEIATGAKPLPQDSVGVERIPHDLPDTFRQIVRRALERNRRDRYARISDLARDLESLKVAEVLPETRPAGGARPAVLDPSPVLSPGNILAGRFRVIAFLARGGMGEVYEAEDLELREDVALKTVRPALAGEEGAMERFKREIYLARRVTHQNVCRIYDVFNHIEPASSSSASQKITFLSMELLRGETLSERLRRNGPLRSTEALPIARQMVAALAAAHRVGVVHRDFKSSNVMLVPDAGERESRVVVTDFGLALSTATGQDVQTMLGGSDELAGTPAYMAPEQLEGGEITAAADVYAFGVVLYEMVTGKLPFSGESNFAVALKRLKEPAPTPRALVPDLDPVWESAILKCLERAPSERFGSIEEAGASLALVTAGVGTKTVGHRPDVKRSIQRKRRAVLLIGAVVMLLLIGALVLRFSTGVADRTRARRSVAVLGFRNLTGSADAAWLSTALSEMLTTELSAGESLRTIPGENIARMKVEMPLPESSSFSADTLRKIRGYLGADVLISGSYLIVNGVPNKVRVDLRLQDSSNGELLATISEQAQPTEILDLISRSGAQLRERLGVKPASSDVEALHSSQPANLEAARFYAEGLEKLRFFEALQARDLLQKAVIADPRHALAQAALGTSWAMLGYLTRAKEETRKAVDLSAKLSREERLVVEGQYRETSLEWDQAAEIYRTLFGFFPDNVDYGLRLAAAQTSAGRPKAALATVEALRKFSILNVNDPRIDLAEARAGGALSDYKHERTLAAAAAARARESGARLLLAGARLIEGTAASSMGDLAAGRSAFEDARKIYTEMGDRWDAANAATNLAYVLSQSGDLAGAKAIYDESLITYKGLGDRRGTAAVLVSQANLFRNQGNLASARKMHEQALAIYREIGDRIGEAKSLNNIANVLASSGDLQSARKMLESALPIFRETGDRNSAATILGNLADLNAESGDLSRAASLYEEALATFRELDNKSAVAYASSRQADILLIKGDIDAARNKHEEALQLRRQIGEKGSVADSQLALAQIALLQDAPRDAEAPVREALQQFSAEGRKDQEAAGQAILARSLLAQNRFEEAKGANVRAEELASQSNNGSLRLAVAITTASIRAAAGDTVRAANDLDRLAGEARKSGLISLDFEARLAMGKAEAAGGRLVAARNHFASLEQDAARRGYKYIADAAAAAAGKLPRASAPKNGL